LSGVHERERVCENEGRGEVRLEREEKARGGRGRVGGVRGR